MVRGRWLLARVTISCDGAGFVRQGAIEVVPAHGYDHWKAGARAGVEFALRTAGLTQAGVRVVRIEGLSTDTNPTLVAAAAARAVWLAAGFTPTSEVVARLEQRVLASHFEDVPVFDEA